MTALAAPRDTVQLNSPNRFPDKYAFGLAVQATTKLYAGGLVAINAAGTALRPQDTGALRVVGVASQTGDNSASLAVAPVIDVLLGAFFLANGSGADAASVATPYGADLYALDDQTVSVDSHGGTLLRVGYFIGMAPAGAYSGQVMVQVAEASPDAVSPGQGGGIGAAQATNFAAYVITALGGTTYTGTGTGTLTAGSNVAIGTQDGQAAAVGDIVLLPGGTSASQTVQPVDAGLWQVSAVGSGSAPWVLVRPTQFSIGMGLRPGSEIQVSKGTLFGATTWFSDGTALATIGTTALHFYPRAVTQAVTLVTGTTTITNVPIRSATKSQIGPIIRTTANTSTATTGGYQPVGAITPGDLGTATVTVDATVAAGTINNADVSTLAVTIMN